MRLVKSQGQDASKLYDLYPLKLHVVTKEAHNVCLLQPHSEHVLQDSQDA